LPSKNLFKNPFRFVVFVSLYIIIGFTYNAVADKQRGVQALPHYEFWVLSATNIKVRKYFFCLINFILKTFSKTFLKDGFAFVFKKLTCQTRNELVYNSI
jgi:hypothetical protein